MVKLRLTRLGKKKQPFYRIVAMDVRSGRQGQALGLVGTYDPIHAKISIDEESALRWLKLGAQMSHTVETLFHSQGILARWRGLEGKAREDALKKDKPARRRKLAAIQEAQPESETESKAPEPSAEAEETSEAGEATE